MMNEKHKVSAGQLRLLLLLAVAAAHVLVLFLFAFKVETVSMEAEENARIMKVTDLAEAPPPPEEEIPQVEAVAENLIETETEPLQVIVPHGTIITPSWDDYIPIHKVAEPPKFDEREIMSSLLYPPIALRSGIEGRVILELFVDKNGVVQRISVLQENPQERGFGEAAVKAFTGRRGNPARTIDGEAVSARYRYPVSFKIR